MADGVGVASRRGMVGVLWGWGWVGGVWASVGLFFYPP